MSPEIVAGKEYSGFQSDVWALGIVLYVLLCGRFPFKANTEHELYHKIRRDSDVSKPLYLGLFTIHNISIRDKPGYRER